MKNALIFVIFAVTLIMLFGCTEEKIVQAPESEQYQISIVDLPETVSAIEGTTQRIPFMIFVVDMDGNAVADIPVEITSNNEHCHFTPAQVTSSESGYAEVLLELSIPEQSSTFRIFAATGITFDSCELRVEPRLRPERIEIEVDNPQIEVYEGDSGEAHLTINPISAERNSIPGLSLGYRILPVGENPVFGSISREILTDSEGQANATFRSNGDFGDVRVQVYVDEPGFEEEVSSTVEISVIEVQGSLELYLDRKEIYADGTGLQQIMIVAQLKDHKGVPISDVDLEFGTSFVHSVIQSPIRTDSLGRATTIFDDVGVPSAPDSVIVTARYRPFNLTSEVKVFIVDRNPVETINLRVSEIQIAAGSPDSIHCTANARLADGSEASSEIHNDIQFFSGMGRFTRIEDSAQTYYHPGEIAETDTLWARLVTEDDTVHSNQVLIEILPGPPAHIELSAEPDTLLVTDPEAVSEIIALVTDQFGNPVREGTFVTFTTSLGSIHPTAVTDLFGIARSLLSPGITSGIAEVTVSTSDVQNECAVTYLPGNPSSLELTADPDTVLTGGGTGGANLSTLRAILRDSNGNLTDKATTVIFELVDEPPIEDGGSYFQQGIQRSQTQASGGTAVIAFSAGRLPGTKTIRAYFLPDSLENPDEIIENTCTVFVYGSPANIELDVYPLGRDAGGNAWMVEASALVTDILGNPVPGHIPVVFTVNPEIAYIEPGYTGNQGRNGYLPGVAFAELIYNSVNTFDMVEIIAEVQTQQGEVTDTIDFQLPLQEGVLEIHVDPANWMWEDQEEICEIRCRAILHDGHDNRINNVPIIFTSNRGRFWWKEFPNDEWIPFFPDPTRAVTGLQDQRHNEEPGIATVYLRGRYEDIHIDDFPLELSVQINASVEGYDDVQADPAFIFFTQP